MREDQRLVWQEEGLIHILELSLLCIDLRLIHLYQVSVHISIFIPRPGVSLSVSFALSVTLLT